MPSFRLKLLSALGVVWLSVGLMSPGYAHDAAKHAVDIGLVFGLYSKNGGELQPTPPHGKALADGIGKVIVTFVDSGADEFHRKVNVEIGKICCETQFCDLYLRGYNNKISALKERINRAKRGQLNKGDPRKIIRTLRSISEEMQNDFFFDRACAARASNVELTLNELEKHLDYKHDISPDKAIRSSLDELRKALNESDGSFRYSPVEIQKKIRSLASDCKLFKWGSYSHRIYFHWGMEDDDVIRHYAPLKECVGRACEELKPLLAPAKNAAGEAPDNRGFSDLQRRLREKIYSLIEDEWRRRKREALEGLRFCLKKYNNDKYHLDEDKCEMLLKLAYCVHILGDYTTSNTSALIREQYIKEALYNTFADRFWGHKEGDRIMTKLRNEFASRDTAEEMLDFLKAEIPALVEYSPKIRDVLR